MNTIKWAYIALGATVLLQGLSSCSSDPNPFDVTVTTESVNTLILLNLKVASTRAESDFSADRETKIAKVSIYIFGENNKLESVSPDLNVDGNTSLRIEVLPGLKTVYAVSAKSGLSAATGTSIIDFEKSLFPSKMEDLCTDDGFVMMGKSSRQQVMKSVSEDEMPSSNVFSIDMVRLVAKAQVDYLPLDASDFGFTVGVPSFKACLTNDCMRVVSNGFDVISNYEDKIEKGVYDGYSLGKDYEYISAKNDNFASGECVYMSENIVANPVSGNTTFLSIKIPFCPVKYYTFTEGSENPQVSAEDGVEGTTFYVVGIVDETNGMSDYTVDMSNKHIITFSDKDQAEKYCNALNGSDNSAITVSDVETSFRAPRKNAGENSENSSRQFKVVEFADGAAYYRINVGDLDKSKKDAKVERNKFYKVMIKSIGTLGYSSEEMLRPKNPEVDIDIISSAWIESIFNVLPWIEVDQPVDL